MVSVLLFLFSIAIVWSEATFSINISNVRLAVFAQLVYLGHQLGNYIAVEVSGGVWIYCMLLVARLVCKIVKQLHRIITCSWELVQTCMTLWLLTCVEFLIHKTLTLLVIVSQSIVQ